MDSSRSEQRKKWKKEVSAGGLVFKKEGSEFYILMTLPKKKDMGDKHFTPAWTFPKGWIGDHGQETIEQAALREVREEGGVEAKIIEKLGESKYFFKWQGDNIFKTVHWFLMEYVSGDVSDHDNEVEVAEWMKLNEAEKNLTHKTDKETFQKAKTFLENIKE
jgi:8-oxo-dGTP pyrophosphatase MutT (NUDIX family)